MAARPYKVVDVFAQRPGAGNQLAVVLDAQGLDEAQMQAIARWTRLAETTFVLPAGPEDDADYRLRIFSPRHEVPFAGHPSVGTAHAMLEAGLATPSDGLLHQQGAAGRLPLRVSGTATGRSIAVRTPPSTLVETATAHDPRLRAALAGLQPGVLPPALMAGGRKWWLVELANEAALRQATPDFDAIEALAAATGSMGVCVFAYCDSPTYQLAVRAWVGGQGRFEDAASGAANATLAAWLAQSNALPGGTPRYRVSQGREVGFDALLEMEIDAAGDVWSGGRVCTVVEGRLDWDPSP